MKYEFLEHTSEVKFKAFGKTQDEAFENSALAISKLLSKGQEIKETKEKTIQVKGKDPENLLYNFIEEIIYLFDAEHFIPKRAEVEINFRSLIATLYGDDSKNYEGLDHIKAATYAEMEVKKVKEKWEIQAVLDI